MSDVTLWHGDCLDLMSDIPDSSIDMILCDLPYGTTACKWDSVIPFEPLWAHYKRIIKPRGAVVLTGSQPFTSMLVMSNPDWFKYEWIWDKALATGFLDANRRPMRRHENVLVFSPEGGTTYNPIFTSGEPYAKSVRKLTQVYGAFEVRSSQNDTGDRYPTSVLAISNANRNKNGHPTQKPVDLFEYLIRTYTNEGDTVLDNCSGSGTTGVAAIRCGRKAILIEKEREYFEIGCKRVAEEREKTALFADASH